MTPQSRTFVTLVAVGVIIRLAAAILTTNSSDLALFGYTVQRGGLGYPLYSALGYSYPPLVGYCWIAAGKLLDWFGISTTIHFAALEPFRVPGLVSADLVTPWASLAIKLPALAFDGATAWIISVLCRRGNASASQHALAVLSWWLNPMVIFDSAVQASWDAVVPLTIVAAGALTVQKRGFSAGAGLAAGALTKVVPILFLPLAVAALVSGERDIPLSTKRLGSFALGLATLSFLVLVPVLTWHEMPQFRDIFFSRVGGIEFGGFNAWIALALNSLANASVWVGRFGTTLSTVLVAFELLALLVISVALFITNVRLRGLLLASVLGLAIVCLTAPYLQPGYVVWLLPFCLILGANGSTRWTIMAGILTICSLCFTLAVRAPAALVIPACAFFKLCDPTAFAKAAFAYAYAPGVMTASMQIDRDVPFGIAGTFAILGVAIIAFLDWWKVRHA